MSFFTPIWLSKTAGSGNYLDVTDTSAIRNMTQEQAQKVFEQLQNMSRTRDFTGYLGKGLVAGLGIGGGAMLLSNMANRVGSKPKSYTYPVETKVYGPPEEEGKKRAQIPMDTISEEDAWGYVPPALGVAVGVPVAYKLMEYLGAHSDRRVRQGELNRARQEFESVLKDYAKARESGKKRAAAATPLERLAENCVALCEGSEKHAGVKEASNIQTIKKMLAAYIPLSALAAGAIGFGRQWENRKWKDLAAAEQRINIDRERRNPTFYMAELQRLPGPKDNASKQDGVQDKDKGKDKEDKLKKAVQTATSSMPVDYVL